VASRFEEVLDHEAAEVLVAENAQGKAREVAARSGVPQGGAVLGADTAVVVDGRPWGKPADGADARRMIAALSGRAHTVMTAICLIDAEGEEAHTESTEVRFRSLLEPEIDWYVETGEWRDRAGGYAIQGAGAAIVETISGDYTSVVGLPVPALATLLATRGIFPPKTA
jgi:septum formation protein